MTNGTPKVWQMFALPLSYSMFLERAAEWKQQTDSRDDEYNMAWSEVSIDVSDASLFYSRSSITVHH